MAASFLILPLLVLGFLLSVEAAKKSSRPLALAAPFSNSSLSFLAKQRQQSVSMVEDEHTTGGVGGFVGSITGEVGSAVSTAVQAVASGATSVAATASTGIMGFFDNLAWFIDLFDKLAIPVKTMMHFMCITKPFLMAMTAATYASCLWQNKNGLTGALGLRGFTDVLMCNAQIIKMLPFGEIMEIGVNYLYGLLMDKLGYALPTIV